MMNQQKSCQGVGLCLNYVLGTVDEDIDYNLDDPFFKSSGKAFVKKIDSEALLQAAFFKQMSK